LLVRALSIAIGLLTSVIPVVIVYIVCWAILPLQD
jgi:phage shock protein PspC (stress-responsive transcriptional regulator)